MTSSANKSCICSPMRTWKQYRPKFVRKGDCDLGNPTPCCSKRLGCFWDGTCLEGRGTQRGGLRSGWTPGEGRWCLIDAWLLPDFNLGTFLPEFQSFDWPSISSFLTPPFFQRVQLHLTPFSSEDTDSITIDPTALRHNGWKYHV